MTKAEALYKFYNSFGIPAYPNSNVPDDVIFPYLIYEPYIANNGNELSPAINLYCYTDSEAQPNDLADKISKAIGQGISIKTDDGAMYIYHNTGWQPIVDNTNSAIKRRYTTLSIVFNTF